MRKHLTILKILLSLLGASLAHEGLALVATSLFTGQRSGGLNLQTAGQANKQTLKAKELGANLSLDPIPLVPVSFGLSYLRQGFDVNLSDHSFATLQGSALIPEVQAWYPFGSLKPYGRLGYAFGYYRGSTQGSTAYSDEPVPYKAELSGRGLHAGAGIKYEPISLPLFHLMVFLELNWHAYTFKDQALFPNKGLPKPMQPPKSAYDRQEWAGRAMYFGLEAGI